MNPYALITGAGKGIGKCIALQLARAGYHVLLVARSEQDLKSLAETIRTDHGREAHYLTADLGKSGAAKQVSDWCSSLNVPVAILVNNAGSGLWGKFEGLDLAGQQNMIRLNIEAVVELSHRLLPLLKKQSQSYILNVASTAAYQAVPTLAVYSATKSFVLSFSRALRYELKDQGVSVSCLCPGPTDTAFATSAGMDALAELTAKFNMSPVEVAQIGLKGMFNKKAEIIPGWINRISTFGARHLNKRLIEKIAASLYMK